MNKGRYLQKARRAERRRKRVRRRIVGLPERPRLVVSRSLSHLYAQIVDDQAGKTLLGLSSRSKALTLEGDKRGRSKQLGQALAAKAKALGIERVVFDRDRYLFHGRIKMFAEGAREGGLKF
jgi:large subunit ribosomal protein L18